jgi:hypothetical protein
MNDLQKELIKQFLVALELNEWSYYTEFAGAPATVWCNNCSSDKKYGHDTNCEVKAAIEKAKTLLFDLEKQNEN